MSEGFDFKKYLTESQITDVAKKVCEEELREYMKMYIRNRSQAGISTIDQIIKAVAELYVEQLRGQYEDRVVDKIKKVINEPRSSDSDYRTFEESLKWQLGKVAEDYINNNFESLKLEMADTIHKEAAALTSYELSSIIAGKINIKDVIMNSLNDHFNKASE